MPSQRRHPFTRMAARTEPLGRNPRGASARGHPSAVDAVHWQIPETRPGKRWLVRPACDTGSFNIWWTMDPVHVTCKQCKEAVKKAI